MHRFLLFVMLTGLATLSWSQQTGRAVLPDDSKGRCRYGAEHMIASAEQSLAEPRSRPERIEKRRRLVADWKTRLKNGEDPCLIYSDIQKAATTF